MKKAHCLLLALIAILALMPAGRVTAQVFTNLHSFNNVTDGNRPSSGVVLSGNTLYGTTFYGFDNTGEIFAINTDGTDFANLYEFVNGGGFNPSGNLVVSGNTIYGTTANDENVYALTINPLRIANLHTFTGDTNDGAVPAGGMILSGNTLYGTTEDGGSDDKGVVYSLNLGGTNTVVLHSFTGGSDGQIPECALVLSGNTLYGTAAEGGTNGGYGTVFSVSTDGKVFSLIHSFSHVGTNGANPTAGLVLSGNTLYGVTPGGGSSGVGTVFKVNTDGSEFQTMHNFAGGFTDGYQPQGRLFLSGNVLYGTTIQGGTGNEGTIFTINTDGTGYAILYSFTAMPAGTNSDGAQPQNGVMLSDNTLYGTTQLGGTSGDGVVFRFTLPPVPTVVDAANHYSYGANFGWVDWRGDTNHGALIGEYVCSGYIYSANVGWINLGSGTPTNGIYYQNLSANDFGVNQDGQGNLRGYAYGANIGWLNFETNGAPEVNLQTGILSGYVWSANCGWMSLSNAFAYVQVDSILPGADSTGDGIPDAWALQNFGTINIDPNADPDHDGISNLGEYLAGTDPNDSNDVFKITAVSYGTVTPGYTTLKWSSKPSRAYAVQYRETLDTSSSWADVADYGLGADTATFNTGDTNRFEFYRIRAFRSLIP